MLTPFLWIGKEVVSCVAEECDMRESVLLRPPLNACCWPSHFKEPSSPFSYRSLCFLAQRCDCFFCLDFIS